MSKRGRAHEREKYNKDNSGNYWGIGMGAAAYYGGMHTEGNSMTNTIINNTNTIELGNVAEKSDKEILNWLIQQYNENQEEVKLLNSEKKKLEEKLESANSKIDSLEEQQSSDAENADQEKVIYRQS